jgi:hypothetical protein
MNPAIAVLLIAAAGFFVTLAYGENALSNEITTDVGQLNVELEMSPPDNNKETTFTIAFIDPVTGYIEPHVDYDFALVHGDVEVFRATKFYNKPVAIMHSVSGIEKFPVKLEEGPYTAKVTVYGFRMVWFTPQKAEFSVNVTPEFPSSLAAPAAMIAMSTAVVLLRFTKSSKFHSRSFV